MAKTFAAAALVLLMATPCVAGPIILSGDAGLHAWAAVDLQMDNTVRPFWSQESYDGNGLANVGWYLSGEPGSDIPGFYAGSPMAFLPYLGGVDTTFVWDREPQFELLQGVTAWVDSLAAVRVGGFWTLTLTGPDGRWESSTLDNNRTHFALFQGTDGWYVGIEDMAQLRTERPRSDWDYNDAIIRISQPVPEAGGTALLLMLAVVIILRVRMAA